MWIDKAQHRRNLDGTTYRQNQALIIAVIFVGLIVFLFLTYLLLRCIRRRNNEPPKFFPEPLKKRWRAWRPGTYTSPGNNTPRLPSTRSRHRNQGQGVSRVESIRSIMTLPEYRPVPAPDRERTIGREGERGGIDVVIEFPETIDEEEDRREEHMQALYEIRLARQLERAAERESGDLSASLNAARRPGSSTSGGPADDPNRPASSTASLIAALQSVQEREQRMSQVSYASVGVTRPDGTRVRPSTDSDRPLLETSAPMGTSSIRSLHGHGRSHSNLSYTSSMGTPERRRSDEIFNMGSARPSVDTRPGTGIGSGEPPDTPPPFDGPTPDYEGMDWGEPPEYSSPVETRNHGPNQLPVLRIDTASPAHSRSPSPQPPQER
ncbi:hypothetical protein EDC01DRAFT_476874 [Geopyxis carbonaria]|nr:hypothetical protein EDC01DRAFT_476874 [Geopyxis carbonaria]